MTDGQPHLYGQPRLVVTRHGRWSWSVRVQHGIMVYGPKYGPAIGGVHAFTRWGIQRKGRRLLASYLRTLPESQRS